MYFGLLSWHLKILIGPNGGIVIKGQIFKLLKASFATPPARLNTMIGVYWLCRKVCASLVCAYGGGGQLTLIHSLNEYDLQFVHKSVSVRLHVRLWCVVSALIVLLCVIFRRKPAGRVRPGPGAGRVEGLCERPAWSRAAGLVSAQHHGQRWPVRCPYRCGGHRHGCQWQQPHLQPGQGHDGIGLKGKHAKQTIIERSVRDDCSLFVPKLTSFLLVCCLKIHSWLAFNPSQLFRLFC